MDNFQLTAAARVSDERYTFVAIVLHWLIAAAIILQLIMGNAMVGLDKEQAVQRFQLYQLHKSVGITILLLSLIRIAWRVGHKPPPLPPGMKPWETKIAHITHVLFYFFLIGLPLSGWIMVSASPVNIPIVLYGLVPWPHVPGIASLPDKAAVENTFKAVHALAALALKALLLLHIAAALKHHFVNKDNVLTRMLGFRRG